MESSIPHILVSLALTLTLILLSKSAYAEPGKLPLTYHNGPILTGNLNLGLVFYGQVGKVQKAAVRSFIRSLNGKVSAGAGVPSVANWWQMVESYQAAAAGKCVGPSPKINVKVVHQAVRRDYVHGKILLKDFVAELANDATGGKPNVIPIIFAAKDVTVDGGCSSTSKCAVHDTYALNGVQQPYVIVGNPEVECPDVCGIPFNVGGSLVVRPPSGDIAADAIVMHFASALAGLVTNAYKTGFYSGPLSNMYDAMTTCQSMYGKLALDPSKGGSYNARGWRGKKFLLPALYNPKTKSCWTSM